MFEYLMPVLVMRSFPLTVLDQTYDGAVRRQIAYGAERRGAVGRERERLQRPRPAPHLSVPRVRRARPRAQARAGPGAGGRALCLRARRHGGARTRRWPTSPQLELLRRAGPVRLPRRHRLHPARSRPALRRRSAPTWRTTSAWAWSRSPTSCARASGSAASTPTRWCARPSCCCTSGSRAGCVLQRAAGRAPGRGAARAGARSSRRCGELDRPDTPQPHVALLGHLPYTIMVSHCGAGYSRYEELAVTRWRADGTPRRHRPVLLREGPRRPAGVWSAAHQPVCAPADWYHALLATDRVTFHRADGTIETRTEIAWCRRTRPRSAGSR